MKYDLHIHTRFSKCSNMEPLTVVKRAIACGLDGIAITDHNTIDGALYAKKRFRGTDFEIIVGAEIKTPHAEIIGLYLNENVISRDFFEVIDEIRAQGGIAIIAHPTALCRSNLKHDIAKISSKIDGIEGFNGRALPFENRKAKQIAHKHGIALTAGSDAHFYYEIGRTYTEFEGSLRDALRKRSTKIFGSSILAVPSCFLSKARASVTHKEKYI